MEENINNILQDDTENVVQFDFENNTSSPVAITLFDNASLLNTPTSGNLQTSFSASNDLFPTLPPSLFALNPNNGTFIASDLTSPVFRLLNTTTNTTENNFDNSIGFGSFFLRSIAIQPDGKILCGGDFTTYKGLTENYIIRLNSDGSKDLTFNNFIGFDNQVAIITIQPDGKILCGGFFTSYKGVSANRIIRLNPDGTKDTTFNYGTGFNGVGGFGVISITIQPDGKILCGGGFNTYKGISANRIIRLNSDGSIDATFNYGTGFSFFGIDSITLQPDGKILCGGAFTTYKGVSANRIIRLNSDGSIDATFNYGTGFDSDVKEIAIQPDGKIICGGQFNQYKGVSANNIIRLNPDGSIDTPFNYGTGFNNNVDTIAIQTDGKIFCGGVFDTYKGVIENGIIRLNPDGSKDLTFDNSIGFNSQNVKSITIQPDGKILCGGAFTEYKGYVNNRLIKLNSDGSSASTLNIANIVNSIQYNSVNNKFYAEYSSGIYVISADAQTIEADVNF
jgi:uncharacterized delta-60 repeat protein